MDGKKKSVPGINVDTSEHGRQESNENQDAFKDKTQRQEAKEEQDMRRLCAISNIQAQGQESERKFTLMDVDGVEMKIEGVEAEFKRNPDGSICEDCN